MQFAKSFAAVLLLSVASMAQRPNLDEPAKIPDVKGLDPALMDKSVDPCTDFYQYSCGGWLKQNPIPPDQSVYGRGTELRERNRLVLRDILEKAAVERPGRSAVEQKIGDFYAACMDEGTIRRLGRRSLKPEVDGMAALRVEDELSEEPAQRHRTDVDAIRC